MSIFHFQERKKKKTPPSLHESIILISSSSAKNIVEHSDNTRKANLIERKRIKIKCCLLLDNEWILKDNSVEE